MDDKLIRIEKVYYSIGEVAEMFNVNTSLIRFWEKEFDVIRPHKNKKGNRLFTQKDIENLRLIYNLVKEKGYTLQGAKDYLKSNREGTDTHPEIIKTLLSLKEFLLDIRGRLDG